MIDGEILETMYQESLEEDIISYLAEIKNINLYNAMNIYYQSRLADKIAHGTYGIQYLDYKVLVQILLDTEPELFETEGALPDGKPPF